jgi:membrane protein DedA with SNARE-associated domain
MFDALERLAEQLVTAYGSLGLLLAMLAENLFPPIPSELVLPLAGYQVSQGTLPFWQALVSSTLGSLLGAVILYEVGRYGGRPLVLRLRHVLRVSEQELDRADSWFDRWGRIVVFVARMIPLVRSVVSLPAGWSQMPRVQFWLLTALGSAIWNALLIGGGVLLGQNFRRVAEIAGTYQNVVLVVLVLAVLALVVWWVRRRQRHGAGAR